MIQLNGMTLTEARPIRLNKNNTSVSTLNPLEIPLQSPDCALTNADPSHGLTLGGSYKSSE